MADKEGLVQKKGHFPKPWDKRWLVLKSKELTLGLAKQQGAEVSESWQLQGAVFEPLTSDGKPCMKVVAKLVGAGDSGKPKECVLAFASEGERGEWAKAIDEALNPPKSAGGGGGGGGGGGKLTSMFASLLGRGDSSSSSSSAPASSPAASTAPSTSAGEGLTTTSSMHLLRLHVIHAQLPKDCDPWAVVSVGKKSAKTRQLKRAEDPRLANERVAVFDEHFVIEYELQDEEIIDLSVAIYEKGRMSDDFIGEWKVKLNQVSKPPPEEEQAQQKKGKKELKESWYTEQPLTNKLFDKSGKKEVGTLSLRARRETKVVGQIQIQVKEATLPSDDETKLNIKLGTQAFAVDGVKGKKGKFAWKPVTHTLDATMANNVRDIFIECLQGEKVIGEVRVTLFDARRKAVKKPQPILSRENKAKIGEMKLSAKYIKPK